MHDAATAREATPDELVQMQRLLRDGLAAGGMGFSSTWSTSHNDHTGVPVPVAARQPRRAARAVPRRAGVPRHDARVHPRRSASSRDETFELMSDMSAAADRPLNWNLLQVYGQNWDNVQHQLTGGDSPPRGVAACSH